MVFYLVLINCTKVLLDGRRHWYGPYGPYWYEYTWNKEKEKMQSRYVGTTTQGIFKGWVQSRFP